MFFEVIDNVPFPLEDVYATMREKLPDLVPYLLDIKDIQCIERTDLDENRVRIINHWYAKDKIPAALKKFVSEDQLGWIDHAEWDLSQKTVKWRLEMMFFKEYVDVSGINYFTGDEKNTQVRLTGDLKLDLARHPIIPRFLAGSITKQVEKVVLALIKPNLVKVNRGIEKHLAER